MPKKAKQHKPTWLKKATQHVGKRNVKRASAAARGYNYRWREARRLFLAENPLCVRCLEKGRAEPALDVDHVIPHRGNWKLFWDRGNWQSLCHSCHAKKTREDQKK